MSLPTPDRPKIYHIIHVDRLASVVAADGLWCDAQVHRREPLGTTIGMNTIKQRRLHELTLTSHPDLHVGDCVPFYFCPRSIMLFLIHRGMQWRALNTNPGSRQDGIGTIDMGGVGA